MKDKMFDLNLEGSESHLGFNQTYFYPVHSNFNQATVPTLVELGPAEPQFVFSKFIHYLFLLVPVNYNFFHAKT